MLLYWAIWLMSGTFCVSCELSEAVFIGIGSRASPIDSWRNSDLLLQDR